MMPEFLKEVALHVGEIDEDINFSSPPTSGQEYIQRVVIEARKCADIVVADIDQIHVKTPTAGIKPLAGCVQAPATICPTMEWQKCQIADFSDVRLNMSQLKHEIQTSKPTWTQPQIELPHLDDQKNWIDFCLGMTPEGCPKNKPLMNIILCMNQPLVEKLLEYLVEYMEKHKKINNILGQWIYALLIVLELPLNPDICSCLRSLARACSVIRVDSENLETQEIAALNLFICLVARYFRQLDLADT